jgi:catalase
LPPTRRVLRIFGGAMNDGANTTNDAGIPVASDEHSLTAGPTGPTLLQDHYLLSKMAQFNRERVPERVVHAKGGGAYGFFEVTEDLSDWCSADFLSQPGRRTPVFARFSTVAGELGSADTMRDPRGFALKFYTGQGNYDLVGLNTPVFFIRDAMKFQDFIRSQKRMSDTGLRSNDAQWDFWSLSPESAHMVTMLMSDRGTPRSWRTMHGYGTHTFMWVNAGGERFWVKYHFKSVQGIDNFTDGEARAAAANDPDLHRRDLFDAIASGDAPEWKVEMQIMAFDLAADYRFNPFDVTKVWPHSDFPPIPIGRLVLDRNPENHFAEVEQSAFEVANMVPGIGPSPDKMLLGRLFSYGDAHRYRIGTNYNQLPVNCPYAEVHSYSKDGSMRYRHDGAQPPYAPNSYGGPKADPAFAEAPIPIEAADTGRTPNVAHRDDDDFVQARELAMNVLGPTERLHLIENIVGHLSKDVTPEVQQRAVSYWRCVDPEIGGRIALGLGFDAMAA